MYYLVYIFVTTFVGVFVFYKLFGSGKLFGRYLAHLVTHTATSLFEREFSCVVLFADGEHTAKFVFVNTFEYGICLFHHYIFLLENYTQYGC